MTREVTATPERSRTGAGAATRSPWLMLAMATIGFAVNFWAWALISPLGPLFRATGSIGTLSESDKDDLVEAWFDRADQALLTRALIVLQ